MTSSLPWFLRPGRTLERGRAIVAEGRVLRVEQKAKREVRSEVHGSRRSPYVCVVDAKRGAKGRIVSSLGGRCSCPVGYNCKHVVATLLWLTGPLEADKADHWDIVFVLSMQSFYGLGVGPDGEGDTIVGVELEIFGSRPGGRTKMRPLAQQEAARLPLRPKDRLALDALGGLAGDCDEPLHAWGHGRRRALEALAATEALCWEGPRGRRLRWSPPRRAGASWILDDVNLSLEIGTDPPAQVAILGHEAVFVDPASGELGLIETALSNEVWQTIGALPSVEPDQSAQLTALLPLPVGHDLRPPDLPPVVERAEQPQPILTLETVGSAEVAAPPLLKGHLSFRYGGRELAAESGQRALWRREGGLLERTPRERAAEAACAERLAALGAKAQAGEPVGGSFTLGQLASRQSVAEVARHLVAPLREEGWNIRGEAAFQAAVREVDSLPEAQLKGTGVDGWLDLQMGVVVDGRRLALAPILAAALGDASWGLSSRELAASKHTEAYLPAPGGGYLALPRARLVTWIEILEALGRAAVPGQDQSLRLPLSDAHLLLDLERRDHLQLRAPGRLRQLARRLAGGLPTPVRPPKTLHAILRPYQLEGLAWMQMLRSHALGGILADDMGLGKTLQVLAHLLVERRAGRLTHPALVICPTSVLGTWAAEMDRSAPGLNYLVYHGCHRVLPPAARLRATVVVTTYGTLLRDIARLARRRWSQLVLDEAQQIKNPLAKTYVAACRLRSSLRLALTGTPLENSLKEVWAQTNFVMPGLLGSHRDFRRDFLLPIEERGDVGRQRALVGRLKPFLLRRTRERVLAELPPLTEVDESCVLFGAQRDLYEVVRSSLDAEVRQAVRSRGLPRAMLTVLDALLKLRQVCCDPRLLRGVLAGREAPSCKLSRLVELVPEMVAAGRRILVFSQFTSMLALIGDALDGLGIGWLLLTGKTRRRDQVVAAFRGGEAPVFLISLRAGGTGLNLPEADTVIHYDPWWNPAVENQATARAHRMGQTRPVFVHRLVAAGSVEERILALQARKRALADALLAGGRLDAALDLTDVERLFAPLTGGG